MENKSVCGRFISSTLLTLLSSKSLVSAEYFFRHTERQHLLKKIHKGALAAALANSEYYFCY